MKTESDLELLEAYLDDGLSDQDLARVALRLSKEPELAAELERLRGEREMRKAVWASLEPREAEVEHLLGRVDEAVRRRAWWERQARWGRWGAAAAACIVFGFTTGWFGRGPAAVDPMVQRPTGPVPQVAGTGGGGGDPGRLIGSRGSQMYQVQLTNDSGQVIAVQTFDSLEKARAFAADLQSWQDRQRQMQSGNVVLTGGKF